MKSIPRHVIIVIEMDDGKMVQRPLKREEINFVLPILQEFDGGTLKVSSVPEGIKLEKKS